MIRCPSCNARAYVKDARTTRTSIRRVRACTKCNARWTTYELTRDLGALIGRLTREFEPTRRRLKHVEEELLVLEKLLNAVSIATVGTGPKSPIRYSINDVISRSRPWSAADIKVLDDLYSDYGSIVVSERLGRTTNAVQQQAHKRRLKRNYASTHKAEDLQEHQQGCAEGGAAEAGGSDCPEQSKHG